VAKKVVLVGATLVVLAVGVVSAAAATIPVSGSFTVLSAGATTCTEAGPNVLHCTTPDIVTQYFGDLQGFSTLSVSGIINCTTGFTQGTGTEVFTGSVAGVGAGSLTWFDSFTANFDCNSFVQSGTRGTAAIRSGTGALALLSGSYKFNDSMYNGAFH
jgi:hypothetical protein